MVTVVESAVGLEPMYEEARKRPDWPKWEEAIQKELVSLETLWTPLQMNNPKISGEVTQSPIVLMNTG